MPAFPFLQPPPSPPEPSPSWWSRPETRRRAYGLIVGGAAGGLFGFFLITFGLDDILGAVAEQVMLFTSMGAGAVLGAVGVSWIMLTLDALCILLYLFIADTPTMLGVAARWVRNDPLPASADAIVVLSATVNADGMLNDQGVARLLTGIELYQRGLAPRLFTTAVENTFGSLLRSSTGDQERLITLGGAREAWTSLTGVSNTRDEAIQAASQLPPGTREVIVVTAPMHTRRACATFEAVGFKVACVPSREHEYVAWHPLSSRDRMEAFRQYLYERLGMVKYRTKGWIPPSP